MGGCFFLHFHLWGMWRNLFELVGNRRKINGPLTLYWWVLLFLISSARDLIFNAPFIFSFRNNLFFSGLQSHCSFLYFDLPNSLILLVLFLMFVIFFMFDKNFLISLCLLIKYRIYGNFHDIRLERVNHIYIKGQRLCYTMSWQPYKHLN